ncbi:hypothetical protein [Methylomonas sp. AM2-LC]|uniref:hypothetical protein n=1 Tax=Methylomonas sp. AM2-LC TaxID=3153301 RepID=UPI003267D3CE
MYEDQIKDRYQANKGKTKLRADMLFEDNAMEQKSNRQNRASKVATNFADLKHHLKDVKEDM